jgi:hypothetical protein
VQKPTLHLITGQPAKDTPKERVRKRVKAMPNPADFLQCPRCGGRELIEARIGVPRGGSFKDGTPSLLCTLCLMRGERVTVT